MGGSGSKSQAEDDKKAEEEVAAAAKKAEEDRKAKEAAEEVAAAAKKAEEERKAKEAAEEAAAAEAARRAEEERKAKEAADAARQAADTARKAEEEQKAAETAKQAADAARKAEEAKETGTSGAVKTEEVKVELETGKETAAAAAPPPGLDAPSADAPALEPSVRRAAAKLRKLKPEQRPATVERLESWLLCRCCRSSSCGSSVPPSALAAALHKQLVDHPKLQRAMELFISSPPEEDPEAYVAQRSKIILQSLVKSEDHFLSRPLVWRYLWLTTWAQSIPGSFRPKPAAVLAELCARGVVAKTSGPEGGGRLTYDRSMLAKVPEPPAAVPRDRLLSMPIEAEMVKTAQSSLSMPFLYTDVSVPLGHGFVRKANVQKLTGGAVPAKEPKDVAKRLNEEARRFLREAAEATSAEAPSHMWAKADIKDGKLVVAVEIAPRPKDEGLFEKELRSKINASLTPGYNILVEDLVLNAAFFGHGGRCLKRMDQCLNAGVAVDRNNSTIGIARGPQTTLSEADLREVIRLLAGKPPPFKISVPSEHLKHVIGKGGRKLQQLMANRSVRLRITEDGVVEGWPNAMRLPRAGDEDFMKVFQEAAKLAEKDAREGVKDVVDRATAIARNQEACILEKGPGGNKLERTFSSEYQAMKHDRSANWQRKAAKKAQGAGRRQGGGRGHAGGELLPRSALSDIMRLRKEVIAGVRALSEIKGETTTQEMLARQSRDLEGSMRELLTEATEALHRSSLSSLKVIPMVNELQQLLHPDNLQDRSVVEDGDMLQRLIDCSVWQRLDALAKAKPPHAPKELIAHVRKGQAKMMRDTEKGGRYKPGEVASATGQNVEEADFRGVLAEVS